MPKTKIKARLRGFYLSAEGSPEQIARVVRELPSLVAQTLKPRVKGKSK